MCGQTSRQKCMLTIDAASGQHANLIFQGPPLMTLGVLSAPSASQPLIAWESRAGFIGNAYSSLTGNAYSSRVLVLDWTQPTGSQVVFKSAPLPGLCDKRADECTTYDLVYVDDV